MKKIFCTALAIFSAMNAFTFVAEAANNTEILKYDVALVIAKCEKQLRNCHTTSRTGYFQGEIEIALNNCHKYANGSGCSGSWVGTVERDGVQFIGKIDVLRFNRDDNTIHYDMNASIEPIDSASDIGYQVNLGLTTDGKMPTFLRYFGGNKEIRSSSGLAIYRPRMNVRNPRP